LDERSRFSEEIKNTNRCEKELISCRTQLDSVTKRKVNNLHSTKISVMNLYKFFISYQIIMFIKLINATDCQRCIEYVIEYN